MKTRNQQVRKLVFKNLENNETIEVTNIESSLENAVNKALYIQIKRIFDFINIRKIVLVSSKIENFRGFINENITSIDIRKLHNARRV